MLSDILNLFASCVTDSLTKRSQTRGLGWLETSLTRKESGWGATVEVERRWGHRGWSSCQARTLLDSVVTCNALSRTEGSEELLPTQLHGWEKVMSLFLHPSSLPSLHFLPSHFFLFRGPFFTSGGSPQSFAFCWIILLLSPLLN